MMRIKLFLFVDGVHCIDITVNGNVYGALLNK